MILPSRKSIFFKSKSTKYLYHDIWWFISDRFHRNIGQGETKNIKEKVELPWHKRMRGAGVRVDKVTCGFRQQSLCKKSLFTFTSHHSSIWELMTLKANLVYNFQKQCPPVVMNWPHVHWAWKMNNWWCNQQVSLQGELFRLLKQNTNKLTHGTLDAIANTWEAHANYWRNCKARREPVVTVWIVKLWLRIMAGWWTAMLCTYEGCLKRWGKDMAEKWK